MGVRSAQERTVQAQQQFSRWEQGQQEREEHLFGQLFVPKSPFRTTFFSVVRTHPWKVGAQRAEIDRMTSDHGLHHIDQTFQRVDSQVWRKGFETVQDFVRLETGRFWSRHALRTLPLLLPNREEVTSSVFPHWERLNKGVRYRGGWVRLSELQAEITALNAVLNAVFII